MELVIGLIIGFGIVRIIDLMKIAKNRKNMKYIPESGCWIKEGEQE